MSRSKKQLGKQEHLDRSKRVEAIRRQDRKEHKHNRGEADAIPTGYRDEDEEDWESLWGLED